MKKTIMFTLILFLLISCSTKKDLSFIEKGMSYDSIVENLGEPDAEIGSGIHIFVYNLEDGSKLTLSFIELNSLLSATVVDEDNKLTVLVQ